MGRERGSPEPHRNTMRGRARNLTREARGVLGEALELEQVMVHTDTRQDLYMWLVARLHRQDRIIRELAKEEKEVIDSA